MTERTACTVERALLVAGSELDDLLHMFTNAGVRHLYRSPDRRKNATAHVQACISRIEVCVSAIRRERAQKL